MFRRLAGVLVSVEANWESSRKFSQIYIPCCAAQSSAACCCAITVLSQLLFWTIRKSSAPALRYSCIASSPVGVFPAVGGPGEKPIVKALRPLITSTLSALTVTTEPVCATPDEVHSQKRIAGRSDAVESLMRE